MSRMGMWDPKKNEDYVFLDETIREMFEMGGVGVLVHKYLGVLDAATGTYKLSEDKTTTIQDVLLLENRDRKYDPDVYELYAAYNMQDTEFDVRQFGLFLEADTLYLEFHINECLEKIGRKLMIGDVLEFPHLRDDALLDPEAPAINKFYTIDDVTRAAGGWSPVWRPHIYRIKLKPMTASQEYQDILDQDQGNGQTLEDIISNLDDLMGLNDAILAQAEAAVPLRNYETAHFYVVPGDENGTQYPWIYAGDGKPPNGAQLAGRGSAFPENPQEGDWFLRTDYEPNVLFQRACGTWARREVDLRRKWSAANRILESFFNNNNQTKIGTETFAEKQALSKALKPRADL